MKILISFGSWGKEYTNHVISTEPP